MEFLRGPASALYGTGAYYGVINITPLAMQTRKIGLESRLSITPDPLGKEVHIAHAYKGEQVQYQAAASYTDRFPSKEYVGEEEYDYHLNWDDQRTHFLYSNIELNKGPFTGLGVGTIYLARYSGLSENWFSRYSHVLSEISWEAFIPYIRHRREWTDNFSSDAFFKYNRSNERGTVIGIKNIDQDTGFDGSGQRLMQQFVVPTNTFQLYGSVNWENKFFDLIAGIDYDVRYNGSPEDVAYHYFIPEDTVAYYLRENVVHRSLTYHTLSPFAQLQKEFPLLEGLIVTLGARLDNGGSTANSYHQLSPRVGLVQRLTDFLNLKLLYGTALWGPTIKEIQGRELNLDKTPELKGTPEGETDLEAEKFRTLEAGLMFQKKVQLPVHTYHIKSEGAYYRNKTQNRIVRKTIPFIDSETGEVDSSTGQLDVNSDDTTKIWGCEFALTLEAEYGLNLFANYAYSEVEEEGKDPISSELPLHKINGGIGFLRSSGVYGSITGRYISGYTDVTADFSTASADVLVGYRLKNGLGCEVKCENILNEDLHYPKYGVPFIPLPDRLFTLTVSHSF